MEGNSLVEDDIRHLTNSMSRNSTVKQLNLSHNFFKYAGAYCISKMISMNSTITSLNLSANFIGIAGIRVLLNAIDADSSIKYIDIRRNPLRECQITPILLTKKPQLIHIEH